MNIIKLPWIFISTQVHGEEGMTSRRVAATEKNTWQICGRQMEMEMVKKLDVAAVNTWNDCMMRQFYGDKN